MKSVYRVSSLIAYIFCVASYASAQERKPAIPLPPPEPDFTIMVKHEYRKDEVITLVSLERMFIKNPDATGEPIGFGSLFGYDEKTQTAPIAYISFYSLSPNCRFPHEPEVNFIVDGESIRISFDPEAAMRGEGIATSFDEPEGGKCNESLDVIVPRKIYLKIARAKSVEVRTGKLKFHLGEMQLKALNELARRLVP